MRVHLKFYIILHLTSLPQSSCGQEESVDEYRLSLETYHYSYLPVEGMGYIQRADLERILVAPTSLLYNDSKIFNGTLFESISKFIVPYELSTEKGGNLMILQTLQMVTEYNLKSQKSGGTGIQILISITLKGSIIDNLNKVSDIINHTNSKVPGTISTLLFHYGSLRLNSEAIPLVREDIEICNRFVKSFSGISNVTCGIVLDARNCGKNEEKLESLNFARHNLIIFDPRNTDEDDFNAKRVSMVPCILATFWKSILGIKQPTPITIDMKTGRFYRKSHLFSAISKGMKFYVQDVRLINVDDMTVLDNSMSSKYHLLTEEWLRRPSQLSKNNFGVTVHPEMVIAPKIMIPHLLTTFRTIIIESPGEHSTEQGNKQYDLVSNIASVAKKLSSRETINNDQRVFKDGIPVQIMFSVTIYHDHWEPNKRAVDDALSAANKLNKIYPEIVKAIVFNWNSCFKSDLCEPIGEGKSFQKYMYKHFKLLEAVFLYAIKRRNSSSIQLGISFDKQLIYDSSYYLTYWDSHFQANVFSKADFFVYKVNVGEDEILEQGALKLSQSFIPKLGPLKTIIESVLRVLMLPVPKTVMYQIKISGCENKRDGGSTTVEQTKVAEYAYFWEIMNNWVVFENVSMIIDTAFEETEHSPETRCRFDPSPFKGAKGCACGWWRVTRSNLHNDGDEGHGVTLTDKKMVAVQLYEAKLPRKVVPPHATLNAWSISALIILAVLITITVSAFAARLGRRHRRTRSSNVTGLTRKDLNDFFGGRATQIGKLVGNLHGVTNEHPDSQPYNKAMYELAPTAFKVGTRCLGTGEFGVVFTCTILRDNVEKDVAVKMIRKPTHSIGDHPHGRYLALKGLISEIKLMSYIGEHIHLVKLEGAYTAKLKKGKVMVFTEYCEMGSLENYLHYCLRNEIDTGSSETEVLSSMLSNDLYRWAGEIACGMEFLASKNVVHADLATRNVLLNSQKCAKISDFGLSRRLYDYSEYLKTEQGPLPWRWMAPESLRKMIFNEKTDVWSFGVTLWEMYTLGDMPYPGLSWDINFPAMLEGGVRLHEPRWNERNMYSLMKGCWETIPVDRPKFSEIYLMITNNVQVTPGYYTNI